MDFAILVEIYFFGPMSTTKCLYKMSALMPLVCKSVYSAGDKNARFIYTKFTKTKETVS